MQTFVLEYLRNFRLQFSHIPPTNDAVKNSSRKNKPFPGEFFTAPSFTIQSVQQRYFAYNTHSSKNNSTSNQFRLQHSL